MRPHPTKQGKMIKTVSYLPSVKGTCNHVTPVTQRHFLLDIKGSFHWNLSETCTYKISVYYLYQTRYSSRTKASKSLTNMAAALSRVV